jgi:hypothetical protein
VDGALPGIIMKAQPSINGAYVYQQKYYAKGVGFVKAKYLDSDYEIKLIDVHYEP